MIKNLTIRNNINSHTIDLDNNVNIIVGKKGTGKSTLLQIIAEAIVNKKIFKNEYEWFNDKANFDIASVNIDNTEINAQDFSYLYPEENKKECTKDRGIAEIQKILPGYISQKDNRKDSLDSTEYVESRKAKVLDYYVKEILNNDKGVFDDFSQLKNKLFDFKTLQDLRLSFGVVFDEKLKVSSKDTINKIVLINYDNNELLNKFKNLKKTFFDSKEEIINNNLFYNNLLQEFNNENKNDVLLIDNELINELEINTKNVIIHNENLIKTYEKFILLLDRNIKALKCFEYSLSEKQSSYKNDLENNEKFQVDKNDLLNYFGNLGALLKDINKQYKNIIQKEIVADWNLSQKDLRNKSIEYRLDKFDISEKEKDMLLNTLLNSSNKANNVSDLLMGSTIKESFEKKKAIKKLIEDRIKIYAGDEEYKNLSPGQKTLFGIVHTIKSLKNVENEQYLLLDQIEDNLDNDTVYRELVELINEQVKKGKQIFIVTHNANIGTLVEGNTITANIFANKLEDKFVVNQLIKQGDDIDTPKTLYLEGGMKAFSERAKKHTEKIEEIRNGEK